MQTDNPFVNAGIFYVQNVRPGDASAWFLEELNRRIARFTYHPETVTQLPSSGWSTPNPNPNPDPNPKPDPNPNQVTQLPSSGWSTPPHFANADEQANMNDIVASGLLGRDVYGNGVEFYEALTLSLTQPPSLTRTPTPVPKPDPEPRTRTRTLNLALTEALALTLTRRASRRTRAARRPPPRCATALTLTL